MHVKKDMAGSSTAAILRGAVGRTSARTAPEPVEMIIPR
ncbi:hypothetical protein BF49_3378 [Bradyrhizobium sp.]|nr:hypothetical protein BF49_3378 [Bradyrhizobium sp.]